MDRVRVQDPQAALGSMVACELATDEDVLYTSHKCYAVLSGQKAKLISTPAAVR